MRVLVTGANGFLGSHIVRALLKEEYKVRGFVLQGTSEENLEGLECEVVRGNLLHAKDIEDALDGCDYVIHTAAITDIWPSRNKLSWSINFDVVKLLANAVKRTPIKRYVHVGTANSFGFGTMAEPGTEHNKYNGATYGLDYMDSKKAAQDYLLEESKSGLPVVIVNPTFMIGENDSKPGPGEMILSVITGKVPGYATGGRCFAAVKDVAQACVNALVKGKPGECYITGGTNLCYKDFFTMIATIANVKPPTVKIPTFLAITYARIVEFMANRRHKKPILSAAMAKISGDGHYYSSSKAMRELDYSQTSLEQALEEAIDWYDTHGYITKRRS